MSRPDGEWLTANDPDRPVGYIELGEPAMSDVVMVHRDGAGRWRWTEWSAGNHKKIATSGESFASRRNAIKAAKRANPGVPIQAANWRPR